MGKRKGQRSDDTNGINRRHSRSARKKSTCLFNVGTGHATSVNEIASALIAEIAPGLSARKALPQAGELRNAIADPTALKQALGWQPRRPVVDFSDVVGWWRQRLPEGGSSPA